MYLLIFFNIVYAWGIKKSLSNVKIPYEVILSVLAMVTVENYAKNYNTVKAFFQRAEINCWVKN